MRKRSHGSTNISHRSIYLDAEWYIGGNVFLIGYVYQNGDKDQLFDKSLTKKNFLQALSSVKVIYFYGPDIGVIESHFGINLRDKFICINLLKIFRRNIKSKSYKLSEIEKKYGIYRQEAEYKKSVFKIWNDWRNPKRKERLLRYNLEDVVNLKKLWSIIKREKNITNDYLIQNRLL
ncbi:MAG: ribonuclease H-like domain-containing protein [Saprospiraceae bacterium]|nr:ribonuclease H-like domain-containing protein [Saprospiraceae bacterium]